MTRREQGSRVDDGYSLANAFPLGPRRSAFPVSVVVTLIASVVAADEISYRNPWDTEEKVLARGVLVQPIDADFGAAGQVTHAVYHYCDPAKQWRLTTERISVTPGGLLRVHLTEPQLRQRLFETIVSGGLRATLTTRNGTVLKLFCVKAVYDWPGYIVLHQSKELPIEDAALRLKVPARGRTEIAFADIITVEFVGGTQMRVRSKTGGPALLNGE